MRRLRKCFAYCGGGVLVAGFAAPAAFGFATGSSQIVRTMVRTDSPNLTHQGGFEELDGATVDVSVQSGVKRLVRVRFSAESTCVAESSADTCMVRVIARNHTTENSIEMQPAGGGRVFMSASRPVTGGRASHMIERSARIGPGNWEIRMEWGVQSPAGNTVTFGIASYHMTVEVWQ